MRFKPSKTRRSRQFQTILNDIKQIYDDAIWGAYLYIFEITTAVSKYANQIKLSQSTPVLPVRRNLIGSFYFDWHILTGSCKELPERFYWHGCKSFRALTTFSFSRNNIHILCWLNCLFYFDTF